MNNTDKDKLIESVSECVGIVSEFADGIVGDRDIDFVVATLIGMKKALQSLPTEGESPAGFDLFRICKHCNQEYKLPLVRAGNATHEVGFNFGDCPLCGVRDDVWVSAKQSSFVVSIPTEGGQVVKVSDIPFPDADLRESLTRTEAKNYISKLEEIIDAKAFTIGKPESEWISVDDKPLPDSGKFLVLLEDGDMHTANCHPNVSIAGGHFLFDIAPIAHWKPLPKPPQGES